jgi:hypothetical protein
MTQHDQRNRLWRWAFTLGAAGLLLSAPALAQVTPPANLTPLTTFSITGKTSGSEVADTRTADYTLRFTLAPGKFLDPTSTPGAPVATPHTAIDALIVLRVPSPARRSDAESGQQPYCRSEFIAEGQASRVRQPPN